MKTVIHIQKRVGQTPLQVIQEYKKEHPEYSDVKMTYAGRLDPLAEGELILLAGEAVHDKGLYTHLRKEYTMRIVLGITTDTYDSLGLVTDEGAVSPVWQNKANAYIQKHTGTFSQAYPPFSSKTVDGVPLFELTRRGVSVELPAHEVTVDSIEDVSFGSMDSIELQQYIINKNATVDGDFRQKEIRERWNDYFNTTDITNYPTVSCRVVVSSGFYVRTFAHDMGQSIGCGALALDIVRTRYIDVPEN